MNQNDRIWWVSATAVSLTAFSFFAGLGVRGLYTRLNGGRFADGRAIAGYPQIASAKPSVPDADSRPATRYWEVLRRLNLYYVEQLPPDTKLALGSVEAMLNQLDDPGTRLVSKAEMDALAGAGSGHFTGLGAVLAVTRYNSHEAAEAEAEGGAPGAHAKPRPESLVPAPKTRPAPGMRTLTVVSVAPGSPAEKAGILPGDHITDLDGHWIAPAHVSYRLLTQLTDPLGPQDLRPRSPDDPIENRPPDPEREKARKEAEELSRKWKNATDLPTAVGVLLGSGADDHDITVERGRPAKPIQLKVRLAALDVPTFESRKLSAHTGYVRILAFNDRTPKDLETALADFQKSGVKNLVVDLRSSAGGNLDAATRAAGLLIGPAKFAVLQERDAARKPVMKELAAEGGTARFKPAALSVLVDGGTAGTSELFAAALKDDLGAKLVGSTTFGDGTEQRVFRLEDGSGLSITHAKMLTAKKGDFDGKGLKPDVPAQGDPLETAVKALPGA